MPEPLRVLFLCTGNSCRSILAEALLNHTGEGRFQAFSAGSQPTGEVHPQALGSLLRAGIPTEGLYSKSWDAFRQQPFDYIITTCGHADAACPVFPGPAKRLHWGLDDPATFQGSQIMMQAAFDEVRDRLARQIGQWILTVESLPGR